MDVGVRELKKRLSEYLERAAHGERITVTERGRAKAVIGPLPGGDNVERGIAEGWITRARSEEPLPPPPRRFRASISVQDMINEDRSDE